MAKKPERPLRFPWDLVPLQLHEASAIKAIPDATFAVIEKLCGVGRNPFRDGGEEGRRATDYACGKLSVANVMRALREAKANPNPRGPPPPGPGDD